MTASIALASKHTPGGETLTDVKDAQGDFHAIPLCRHIRTNGLRCKSPALTEAPYCYFHSRLNERHSRYRHTAVTRGYLISGQHIQLSTLEDRESIQVALSVVINALATGGLDARRATALLYGLQLASSNAARLNLAPYAPDVVRTAESTPTASISPNPAPSSTSTSSPCETRTTSTTTMAKSTKTTSEP